MPGATAPRLAVTRPAGGPAAEAWKEIYMSGGREIVTLRSALYRVGRETLSPLLWGNREARRPSPIYPPFRPPSITASPALGVAGDAGGFPPPPHLSGIKGGVTAQTIGQYSRHKRGQRLSTLAPCGQCVGAGERKRSCLWAAGGRRSAWREAAVTQ